MCCMPITAKAIGTAKAKIPMAEKRILTKGESKVAHYQEFTYLSECTNVEECVEILLCRS